uniref:DUF444 family protein n=1 Tax=Anisakis simplex TaxID=6269 RepID=A0A0M3K076_ANISI
LSFKRKSRNRLGAEADVRIAINNEVPRFEKLYDSKHEQKSN